MLIMSKYLNLY